MSWRRVRGVILRLAHRRLLAIVIGVGLAAPAAWVQFSARYAAWWVQGISLIAGATGVALIWTGITGRSADWVE